MRRGEDEDEKEEGEKVEFTPRCSSASDLSEMATTVISTSFWSARHGES